MFLLKRVFSILLLAWTSPSYSKAMSCYKLLNDKAGVSHASKSQNTLLSMIRLGQSVGRNILPNNLYFNPLININGVQIPLSEAVSSTTQHIVSKDPNVLLDLALALDMYADYEAPYGVKMVSGSFFPGRFRSGYAGTNVVEVHTKSWTPVQSNSTEILLELGFGGNVEYLASLARDIRMATAYASQEMGDVPEKYKYQVKYDLIKSDWMRRHNLAKRDRIEENLMLLYFDANNPFHRLIFSKLNELTLDRSRQTVAQEDIYNETLNFNSLGEPIFFTRGEEQRQVYSAVQDFENLNTAPEGSQQYTHQGFPHDFSEYTPPGPFKRFMRSLTPKPSRSRRSGYSDRGIGPG